VSGGGVMGLWFSPPRSRAYWARRQAFARSERARLIAKGFHPSAPKLEWVVYRNVQRRFGG